MVVVSVAGLPSVRSLLLHVPCDCISTCLFALVRVVACLLWCALLRWDLSIGARVWSGIGTVAVSLVRGWDVLIYLPRTKCCCMSTSTCWARTADGRDGSAAGHRSHARAQRPALPPRSFVALLCPPVYRSTEHLVVVSVAGLPSRNRDTAQFLFGLRTNTMPLALRALGMYL